MREPALKLPLSELEESAYHKGEEAFKAGYVTSRHGLKVSRVIVWGIIVQAYESEQAGFRSVMIDDFTGVMPVHEFSDSSLLKNVTLGEKVEIVGKVRLDKHDEVFILPESVVRISVEREVLRRVESLRTLKSLKGERIHEKRVPREGGEGKGEFLEGHDEHEGRDEGSERGEKEEFERDEGLDEDVMVEKRIIDD